MRERKIVKLRVDMYEDTKFKIIDMKPERDLIQCVWTKLLALAGKVNLEGDLYMSKTLPYTIETLAIEFNRDFKQIKLALDVFIELEMIELSEANVYRVKNFAKHQNIKVKEKIKNKEVEVAKVAEKDKLKIIGSTINEVDNLSMSKTDNKVQDNIPIPLGNKKINKKKKKEKILEITKEDDDTDIVCFQDYDEKRPLGEGETLVDSWSFRVN